MGPFRQQLIRLVAFLVAINLAIGVVALVARNDTASVAAPAAQSSHTASRPGDAPGGTATQSGGILAGGRFSKRRTMSGQSISQAAAGTTAPAAPALSSTATPSSNRPAPTSTGGSSPARGRPQAPTTGTGTGTGTGAPTTMSTSGPGMIPSISEPPTTTETETPGTEEGDTPPTSAAPANSTTTPSSRPSKPAAPPSTTSGVWTVIDDPAGDTVVDGSQAPQPDARADLVQSRATNTTKAIGFAVKVAQPVDPTRDPNWASAETFVFWEVDTTGDGKPDFEIEYFAEGGKLLAGVNRAGGQAACDAEPGFMSDNYVVGVDPACFGSPAALSYRATIYYDTDPKVDNAGVITDVSPDGAMSAPLGRTAA